MYIDPHLGVGGWMAGRFPLRDDGMKNGIAIGKTTLPVVLKANGRAHTRRWNRDAGITRIVRLIRTTDERWVRCWIQAALGTNESRAHINAPTSLSEPCASERSVPVDAMRLVMRFNQVIHNTNSTVERTEFYSHSSRWWMVVPVVLPITRVVYFFPPYRRRITLEWTSCHRSSRVDADRIKSASSFCAIMSSRSRFVFRLDRNSTLFICAQRQKNSCSDDFQRCPQIYKQTHSLY